MILSLFLLVFVIPYSLYWSLTWRKKGRLTSALVMGILCLFNTIQFASIVWYLL